MAHPMRVLIFDVETAPLLAHVWDATPDFIPHGQILSDKFLLCWAAKWTDGRKVLSAVLTGGEALEQNDTRIVAELADLIRQADLIVAHNGDRFDLPVLNTRLFALGLEPVGPVKTIDTLTLAKRSFRLAHNNLDSLSKFLGLGGKLKTGFDLWRRCYQGDEEALAKLVRYCKNDVVILEKVFEKMKAYVKGLPRLVNAERESERVCPFCGSDDLHARGTYMTNASTWLRLHCQNPECRRYSRVRTPDRVKKVGLVPL